MVTEVVWTVSMHWMLATSSLDGHSVNGLELRWALEASESFITEPNSVMVLNYAVDDGIE